MSPEYSICISNYNMSSTLEESLLSVIEQLDSNYEVIIVDDGSFDNSLEILFKIEKKYPLVKVIPLKRDKRRKLGETRNISVRAARGKYVLLHLDTDDIWEPYIKTFTNIYHDLEKRLQIKNFMLSGKQLQMATQKLILKNPYPNYYYTEDRVLWNNLAVQNRLIAINHKEIRRRIPIKSKRMKLIKAFKSQFSSMIVAFGYSPNAINTAFEYLLRVKKIYKKSFVFSIITLIFLLPSLIYGRFFKRQSFVNQIKGNPRYLSQVSLKGIEEEYYSKYGKFNLNEKEREIFIN